MVSLTAIISFVKENPAQKSIEAADLTISSLSELQAFAEEVNQGNDYSGCIVELGNNIDCNGEHIVIGTEDSSAGCQGLVTGISFNGTFDGNGYTISNISNNDNTDYASLNLGFFCVLGTEAKVINTRFYNFSYTVDAVTSSDSYTGCIAYGNNGTIEKCIVENFTFISKRRTKNVFVGSIAGINNDTIRNCEVKGYYSFIAPDSSKDGANIKSFTYTNGSTISNCVFNINKTTSGGNFSYDGSMSEYSDCKNSSGTFLTGSSWSSIGGDGSGAPWYYASGYNGGWPMLRVFMSWQTVYFYSGTGGSVSPSSIEIPSDASYDPSVSGATLSLLGQSVTAHPYTGYNFWYWDASSRTAYFSIKTYTLSFGTTIGDLSISPSGSGYTVNHGTGVSGPSKGATGTISYSFGSTVTYNIPKGYCFDSDNRPSSITGNTTITPVIKRIVLKATLKGAANSDNTTNRVWNIDYEGDITYNSGTIEFSYGGNKTSYSANEGYSFDYIKINGEKVNQADVAEALTDITEDIEIEPVFSKNITIKLMDIDNANLYLYEDSTVPIQSYEGYGLAGKALKAEYSGYPSNIVKYTYDGGLIAVYKIDKFYRLKDGKEDTALQDSVTIYPVLEFFACLVTMDKTGNTNVVDIDVTGDDYGTENDGIFAVEFGTQVEFSFASNGGVFIYTYTFNSGQVVKYTIKDDDYTMASVINGGEREWQTCLESITYHVFDGPEEGDSLDDSMTSKEIKPTFERKFYGGNLA